MRIAYFLCCPSKSNSPPPTLSLTGFVYKLYSLTDEEIELIERPAYEQALATPKQSYQRQTTAKRPRSSGGSHRPNCPARRQTIQSQHSPSKAERSHTGPGSAWLASFQWGCANFLLTGEYNIRTLPEHLDFSTSIIGYTKAVEQAIMQRIFEPFRDAGYGPAELSTKCYKAYMKGKKKLTLGNFSYIFTSKEKALQAFAEHQYPGKGRLCSLIKPMACVPF